MIILRKTRYFHKFFETFALIKSTNHGNCLFSNFLGQKQDSIEEDSMIFENSNSLSERKAQTELEKEKNLKNSQINVENITEKAKKLTPIKKNSVSNESMTIVYAQYLPLNWSEKDLRRYFDPYNQYIKRIVMVKNRLGSYNGKALFEFVSKEVSETFVNKWHENFIESSDAYKRIVFKPFHLKTNSQKAKIEGGIKQVYIYNFDASATPDDIYSVASEFGEITRVQFPIHEGTKKHKGYGFLTFKTTKAAQKFREWADGKEFFGKTLRYSP